jgi:uncharacterized protein YccT (UPF0319 family)
VTRLFYILCLGVLTSAVSLTLSATSLTISDNLIVSKIDDKTVEHGFIGKKSSFTLHQGEHALVVRYKDVFEDLDFAEHRLIESKEFVVKFSIAQEQQIKLTTVDIKDLQQAQNFAKAPELILKDDKNNQLVLELLEVSDYKLAKQVDKVVSTLAKNKATDKTEVTVEVHQVATNASNTLLQVDSLTMLKYWWQTASHAEKNQFKQFLKEN